MNLFNWFGRKSKSHASHRGTVYLHDDGAWVRVQASGSLRTDELKEMRSLLSFLSSDPSAKQVFLDLRSLDDCDDQSAAQIEDWAEKGVAVLVSKATAPRLLRSLSAVFGRMAADPRHSHQPVLS
jgi:hypothetical protein